MNKIDTLSQQYIIKNPKRIYGSARELVYCEIDGIPALFTHSQINTAITRASRDPKNLPQAGTLWQRLFKK